MLSRTRRLWTRGWLAVGIVLGLSALAELSDRTLLAIEALQRLKGSKEPTPALQQAARQIALQITDEPEFVDLVREFRLGGMESNLVAFAVRHTNSPAAAEAIRECLGKEGLVYLGKRLEVEGTETAPLLLSLAASGDPRCVPLVSPLLQDSGRPVATRILALQVSVSSVVGASNLLEQLRTGSLPPELAGPATTALKESRWPEIRSAVSATSATAPRTVAVLPPVPELVAMKGDPARGARVFRRPDVACIGCHQVRGEGIDFGPKLTEIGAKLGKDALIAAILDPSAGISFGFEAWRFSLKDGDDVVGLISSETDQEVLVKQQGGSQIALRKANITGREKLAISIMPAGLQDALSLQEFVDLIEYLASLRPEAK